MADKPRRWPQGQRIVGDDGQPTPQFLRWLEEVWRWIDSK